jgi:hypothetical protein
VSASYHNPLGGIARINGYEITWIPHGFKPPADGKVVAQLAASLCHEQWPLAALRSMQMLKMELPHQAGGVDLMGRGPNQPFR